MGVPFPVGSHFSALMCPTHNEALLHPIGHLGYLPPGSGDTWRAMVTRVSPYADWTSNIGSTGIRGVLAWRFDRRRINPRRSSDFLF